ncbi:MAG: Arm DNA-binding domain-containing protein [Mucilaginibacter sp.]
MKSNQKLTLLFWHRKSKADANGFAPVICRMMVDGSEEELAIGRKVHLDQWDVANKKAKGSGAEVKKTNFKINEMTVDLERQFNVLCSQFTHITALMMKNVYQGLPAENKKDRKPQPEKVMPTLLQTADLLIADFTRMVDKKLRSPETLKQWRATRRKIEELIIFQYACKDLDLAEIECSKN